MPGYKHASFGGETITLENKHMRLDMHKRICGWGWGEIYSPSGKFMAVLDHLGEIMLRDQDIPMRLEADSVSRESGDFGDRLVFHVKSTVVQEKLKGTSFEGWMRYPFDQYALEGEVTLTLAPDEPVLHMSQKLVSKLNGYARYIRGPWLKVGEDSFGTKKDDAIFPGVEWMIGDEWSSGTDWFKDPWALKYIPHPNKVSIPVMAVSHEGTGIGLAWNPNAVSTGWFNYRKHTQQPVFASPNFLDRMNNHVMGLMVPDVETEAFENKVYADPPLELHLDQRITFDADIFLSQGDSLQVITDWVKRKGMPKPCPRWPYEETLDRIATAYNTRFWYEGKGFGNEQHPQHTGPSIPAFLEQYVQEHPDTQLGKELKEKLEWCSKQPGCKRGKRWMDTKQDKAELLKKGQELLSYQHEDGSFSFDPDGRHYTKDDFVVARGFIEPMGLDGDTALDISILPAMELLRLAGATGEETFKEGARKALDCCMEMKRPEGGDFWETPLHSPNLFAAGHAAVAYYLGYEAFGDSRYKDKAIHWIRTLLPFTHLWEPKNIKMLYNTKPCLCSSDWYFANWVRDHVQWEVLATFALSTEMGIDWGKVDPELDWHRYHEGITTAAMRWMLDHREENWLPHNMPWTLESYRKGLFDDCFPDTFNTTTGNYGGMVIMPDAIAANIYGVLRYH